MPGAAVVLAPCDTVKLLMEVLTLMIGYRGLNGGINTSAVAPGTTKLLQLPGVSHAVLTTPVHI